MFASETGDKFIVINESVFALEKCVFAEEGVIALEASPSALLRRLRSAPRQRAARSTGSKEVEGGHVEKPTPPCASELRACSGDRGGVVAPAG